MECSRCGCDNAEYECWFCGPVCASCYAFCIEWNHGGHKIERMGPIY